MNLEMTFNPYRVDASYEASPRVSPVAIHTQTNNEVKPDSFFHQPGGQCKTLPASK